MLTTLIKRMGYTSEKSARNIGFNLTISDTAEGEEIGISVYGWFNRRKISVYGWFQSAASPKYRFYGWFNRPASRLIVSNRIHVELSQESVKNTEQIRRVINASKVRQNRQNAYIVYNQVCIWESYFLRNM